jgi:hypothetical protein
VFGNLNALSMFVENNQLVELQRSAGLKKFTATLIEREPRANLHAAGWEIVIPLLRRRLGNSIAVHDTPTMNGAVQQMPPMEGVLLLETKRFSGEAFAFEVVVPQTRFALQIGTALCFAAAGLVCFGWLV